VAYEAGVPWERRGEEGGVIKTLLVANRGEIARRVTRTARGMGIRTVAVYSDPDARSPHVTDADLAVPLGGATSRQSYLDASKILDAARRARADAVHPGYGFLAENAEFAAACAAAGITFVGPSPECIRRMGRKDEAKAIARGAGVPVLPDAVLDGSDPHPVAEMVGFPLLVKPVAGGGGKGMRLVREAGELVEALATARREAASSFGDPAVFVERYLPAARHIEIQVFGDQHGGAVHFGERECSVQRRHQKVLEEAPSPVVTAELRERMGGTAVALVRVLGYVGAGTVEYLFDERTGEFFFLEMNTRLQVEHPVTEQVYSQDLVALQLRIAAGELLLGQGEPTPTGHAIEVRLYAEDPARDFLPTPGPLHRYTRPEAAGVRYDDGVAAPGEVPPFYDPMLAKVIAWAPSRAEAAAKLAAALDATAVHGLTTNRAFLAALLRDPDFLAGDTRTDFLDHHPRLLDPAPATPAVVHLAAAIAASVARRRAGDHAAPPGFRPLVAESLTHAVWRPLNGEPIRLAYRLGAGSGDTELVLRLDGEPAQRHELTLLDLGADGVRVRHDGVEVPCTVAAYPDGTVWVNDPAAQSGWRPEPRLPEAGLAAAAKNPVSQLPGTVTEVLVKVGDRVSAGQKLVVVEAMKMEHPATAAADGVVEAVHVEPGQYVPAHTVLVTLGEG
jgi:3-methylcrotonyl-CoA carboxylase alpha subunit